MHNIILPIATHEHVDKSSGIICKPTHTQQRGRRRGGAEREPYLYFSFFILILVAKNTA